ncbi:hypothetical protein C8J57DRAFT_1249064 [Mycena rebaudengoi]|nr:hypothetical protein C8J57DRAFT_1249064 [Mycena rebaudengoi]
MYPPLPFLPSRAVMLPPVETPLTDGASFGLGSIPPHLGFSPRARGPRRFLAAAATAPLDARVSRPGYTQASSQRTVASRCESCDHGWRAYLTIGCNENNNNS